MRPRTTAMMVKELHTLLANAKIEPPYVLVGHSFGGALVRAYAYSFPNKVIGMVLVDAAHEDLFTRVPAWQKTVAPSAGLFRLLGYLSSFGITALAPESVPARELPSDAAAQYRAITATTAYFDTSVAEVEAFESNLAQVRGLHITSFGNMPLIVLGNGLWKPFAEMPGISDAESQQEQQEWRAMQSDLAKLSSQGKLIIAEKSEHFIQLQQPELVTDAVRQVMAANTSK